MAKFKVGDKVRILDGSNIRHYAGSWSEPMEKYIGTINTIVKINFEPNGRISYYIEGNVFSWDERGLELVEKDDSVMIVKTPMPEIVNYTYDSKTGKTTIKWSDKTETTVVSENPNTADQYTGFVTAIAKKATGNTSHINNLFDKWAIKKPIKDKIAEEKRIVEEIENKRIADKRRAKREKWLIRRESIRIKREYEARKLANEKYGVPMDGSKL